MGQIDVFRSDECVRRYRERREKDHDIGETDLTKLPLIKEWDTWVLVENEFPYDRIAEAHCLLVPKRRFSNDDEMNDEERWDLFNIKKEFSKERAFDLVCESMQHDRSVPGMFHLHFLKLKYRTPLSEFGVLDK